MAHWQASDGTRVSVLAMAQLANMIRRAVTEGRAFPPIDPGHGLRRRSGVAELVLSQQGQATAPPRGRGRVHALFGFARQP